MFKLSAGTWIRIVLFNLVIVAILGSLMRYKIGYEFPYFDQKHIQLSHSHFAFAGWITQTLLVLIVYLIQPFLSDRQFRQYNIVLWLNLLGAYGMLLSFFMQGYAAFSIAFSSLSVLVTIAFTVLFFRHSGQFGHFAQAVKWFRAGLAFAVLSAAGTVVLASMMVQHHIHQNTYLASIYFYLHFQYNGWFFFACIALFISQANKQGIRIKDEGLIFGLLFGSCIPAYFLSTLWAHIPAWLYLIVIFAACAQLAGWFLLLKNIFNPIRARFQPSVLTRFLVWYIALAGSAKFLLQLGSTIPVISTLAFGFRPIVIAYLHLVLLAFISILLILYMYSSNFLLHTRAGKPAIYTFAIGVFLNELVLAVQGIASLGYIVIPYTNGILFAIALLLFSSACWLFISQSLNKKAVPGS